MKLLPGTSSGNFFRIVSGRLALERRARTGRRASGVLSARLPARLPRGGTGPSGNGTRADGP